MSRRPDSAKLQEWTARLRRFEKSKQTVATFCSTEGVSQATFYRWSQRLGRMAPTTTTRRRQRSATSKDPSPRFQPVFVTPGETAANVTIRLPDGVVMEFGNDIQMVGMVVRQLLMDQASTPGAGSC